MTKDEFLKRLAATGSTPPQCYRDLGIAASTLARWGDKVPGYAEYYLVSMERLNSAGRMDVRHHLALERLPEEGG